MAREFNQYIVEYQGMRWDFNHNHDALEFIEKMWKAKGDVVLTVSKLSPNAAGEEEITWQSQS